MEYKIVQDHDLNDFLRRVRSLFSDGWQPQGGVSLSVAVAEAEESVTTIYCQAMIKED